MDGLMLLHRPARGSRGVLLVDRPAEECWIYEWDPSGLVFRVRDEEPMVVITDGRIKAAEEMSYDVIAAPWVGAEGDEWRR